MRGTPWESIERESGLTRAALEAAATEYARANALIGIYGMGLTSTGRAWRTCRWSEPAAASRQHRQARRRHLPGARPFQRAGAAHRRHHRKTGARAARQAARAVRLRAAAEKGLNTVETCDGVLAGSVKAFIGLGGNFVRAVPETRRLEPAWRKLALTVQIATKLNRSHLIHGEVVYLLPCLGRIEIDRQAGAPQAVTMEDSTGCMHGSRGVVEPAADTFGAGDRGRHRGMCLLPP